MTEFTPTTAQVRAAYSYDPTYEYLNPIGAEARRKEAEREFDRWLESVERDGDATRKELEELRRERDALAKVINEIRMIPHRFDPRTGLGGFDVDGDEWGIIFNLVQSVLPSSKGGSA